MTNDEKRQRINAGTRWIAGTIFGIADSTVRFVKAYEKLHSRFYLDYGYSLSDRLKSPKTKDKTIFDVLCDGELEMLLQSLYRLEAMYNEVLIRKAT